MSVSAFLRSCHGMSANEIRGYLGRERFVDCAFHASYICNNAIFPGKVGQFCKNFCIFLHRRAEEDITAVGEFLCQLRKAMGYDGLFCSKR